MHTLPHLKIFKTYKKREGRKRGGEEGVEREEEGD